jgi:glutamine synthetase type III
LNSISSNINKVIDQEISNNSLVKLQTEFNDKYEKILVFKGDPYSDDYHEKYNELKYLDNKIDNIQVG